MDRKWCHCFKFMIIRLIALIFSVPWRVRRTRLVLMRVLPQGSGKWTLRRWCLDSVYMVYKFCDLSVFSSPNLVLELAAHTCTLDRHKNIECVWS